MPQSEKKRLARRPQLIKLLTQGKTYEEIAKALDISTETVKKDIRAAKDAIMRDSALRAEKALKLLSVKEQALTLAQNDVAILQSQSMDSNGKLDAKRYKSLSQSIKTLTDTAESLEKTYSRFSILPSERTVVEHEGGGMPVKLYKSIDVEKFEKKTKG